MATLDYENAANLLQGLFEEAEEAVRSKAEPPVEPEIVDAADKLFQSHTQSYREALLGCGLARLLDASVNIRQPYARHGENAFNGRTLDECVINPFLQDRGIPCSKGPYLASFRRSVKFVPETAEGLRDKKGYSALLAYIGALENADEEDARRLMLYLLCRFVLLRNEADVPLSRISRLSLEQIQALTSKLLQVQSGGLVPVLLAVAMLQTVKSSFRLPWEIRCQGINVADKASGAGGDVTVEQEGKVVLALEVTERTVEESRVVSTFNTKIVRGGIEDYLFVYSASPPSEEARQAARRYFSSGHEINFLPVQDWVINNLGTLGAKGRSAFLTELLSLFEARDVPASVKIAWNDIVKDIVGTFAT